MYHKLEQKIKLYCGHILNDIYATPPCGTSLVQPKKIRGDKTEKKSNLKGANVHSIYNHRLSILRIFFLNLVLSFIKIVQLYTCTHVYISISIHIERE